MEVFSRIIHVELEFYCPLYPGEDVFPSESLYPGGTRVIVHIRVKKLGKIRRTPIFGTFKQAQKSTHEQPELGFG
jgi:hypothetical protein